MHRITYLLLATMCYFLSAPLLSAQEGSANDSHQQPKGEVVVPSIGHSNSEKIELLEDEIDKQIADLKTVNKLLEQREKFTNSLLDSIAAVFVFFSIAFSLFVYWSSRRTEQAAQVALQSIQTAAESTKAQAAEISDYKRHIDSFRKQIRESEETLERIETLSNAVDLDLAILVDSEGKLNAINFMITDYRNSNDENLKERLTSASASLPEIKMKLVRHLERLKHHTFEHKTDLRDTIRRHIYRNLIIQALIKRDFGQLSDAINLLSEAEVYADEVRDKALVHYNKACYYSLQGILNSSGKSLGKSIEIDTSFIKTAKRDDDLESLKNAGSLWSEALRGGTDD